MLGDEEVHRHAVANLERADALLFGRVTYTMMEEFWRPFARDGTRGQDPRAAPSLNAFKSPEVTISAGRRLVRT